MNRGHVTAKDKLYQLKALQEAGKKIEVSDHQRFNTCAPTYLDLSCFILSSSFRAFINIFFDMLFSFVCLQYLNQIREMEGYGSIVFPHCTCDSRKDGHVIPIVNFEGFKLQACKEDGTEEV